MQPLDDHKDGDDMLRNNQELCMRPLMIEPKIKTELYEHRS